VRANAAHEALFPFFSGEGLGVRLDFARLPRLDFAANRLHFTFSLFHPFTNNRSLFFANVIAELVVILGIESKNSVFLGLALKLKTLVSSLVRLK
jgi:hypothetical protein